MTRAERLAATLRDLAAFHGEQKLRDLADRIDRDFVRRGRDVEEHFVHAVIDAAAATFGEGAR